MINIKARSSRVRLTKQIITYMTKAGKKKVEERTLYQEKTKGNSKVITRT